MWMPCLDHVGFNKIWHALFVRLSVAWCMGHSKTMELHSTYYSNYLSFYIVVVDEEEED